MLLILLNWVFISYVSYMVGFATRRLFVETRERTEVAMTMLWGLFIVSLISSIILFFLPAGLVLLTVFVVVAVVVHILCRRSVGQSLQRLRRLPVNKWELAFGCMLLFALLVLSAQGSKINDDGYYYIQTMMWFSEEGFVRGISNLLLPLGLGSSWHVLQALFSFDFVERFRLNDLNGLLVLVFCIFCVENRFNKSGNGFLALLMPIVVVVSIPFLSAPSPDLPIIVLTVIAFYLATSRRDDHAIVDVLILAAFALTIKISAVAVGLLAICIFFIGRVRRTGAIQRRVYLLLFVTAIVYFGKNIYETGYPLFPYDWLGVQGLSWTTPPDLMKFYAAGIKSWALEDKIYRHSLAEWRNPGIVETIQLLWERMGYKGIINKVILLSFPLILLTVIIDVLKHRGKGFMRMLPWFLPGIFVANFFIWLFFAPQYRFILPVYIFYAVYAVWWWLEKPVTRMIGNKVRWVPYFSIVCLFVLSLFPLSVAVNSTSKHIGTIDGFSGDIVVKPHVSYSFAGLDTLTVDSERYYHVKGNSYCWDSPLPCMSGWRYDFVRSLGYRLRRDGERCFVLVPER